MYLGTYSLEIATKVWPTLSKSYNEIDCKEVFGNLSDNEDTIVVSTETDTPRTKHLKSETTVLQARGALQEGTHE